MDEIESLKYLQGLIANLNTDKKNIEYKLKHLTTCYESLHKRICEEQKIKREKSND